MLSWLEGPALRQSLRLRQGSHPSTRRFSRFSQSLSREHGSILWNIPIVPIETVNNRQQITAITKLPSKKIGACPQRLFSATAWANHGHITPPKSGEGINVAFIDKEGERYDFQVSEGDNLLDIAQANDLEMEGACGGSCACSTCHVIVEDPDLYDRMPEPDDDENDMLDLAFGLTETSRLGCQVKVTKDLDGLVVRLPSMTRNMQASDFTDKKR